MSKLDAIVASSGNAPDAAAGQDAAQGELAIFQERVASEQQLNAMAADAYTLAREAVAPACPLWWMPPLVLVRLPCRLDEERWCVQPTCELQRPVQRGFRWR